jgi:hypothetical protein
MGEAAFHPKPDEPGPLAGEGEECEGREAANRC